MSREAVLQSCLFANPGEVSSQPVPRPGLAGPEIAKQCGGWNRAVNQPGPNPDDRSIGEGFRLPLATLGQCGKRPVVEVQIRNPQPAQFRDSQPGIPEDHYCDEVLLVMLPR